MIIVIILCFSVQTIFAALTVSDQNRKNKEYTCKVLSNGVALSIESSISKPIMTSLTMSCDTFLKQALKDEDKYSETEMINIMKKYLSSVKNELNADTAFVISDSSKKYYSYSGLNKVIDVDNDEHDVWYSVFVNGRKSYDIDVDADEVNGNVWTVFVNCRIEDENRKLLGICGVGVKINEIQDVLRSYEEDYEIKVDLVNSDGLVQVDTDSINIENAYLYDVQYGKEQDGYTFTDDSGNTVFMKYIEDLNWYLVIRYPLSVSKNTYIKTIILSLAMMLLCSAVFIAGTKISKKNTARQ